MCHSKSTVVSAATSLDKLNRFFAPFAELILCIGTHRACDFEYERNKFNRAGYWTEVEKVGVVVAIFAVLQPPGSISCLVVIVGFF